MVARAAHSRAASAGSSGGRDAADDAKSGGQYQPVGEQPPAAESSCEPLVLSACCSIRTRIRFPHRTSGRPAVTCSPGKHSAKSSTSSRPRWMPSRLQSRLEQSVVRGPRCDLKKHQIRSLVLRVDLGGSRRILPAHVGGLVAPDGSRRVLSDRLDDQTDDQAARCGILSQWQNDLGNSGQAAFKFAWILREVAGDLAE
jgi:hypothetical protein